MSATFARQARSLARFALCATLLGITLASFPSTAQACSKPDPGTTPTGVKPGSGSPPTEYPNDGGVSDAAAPNPGPNTGEPSDSGVSDASVPLSADHPLTVTFKAGRDADADPNGTMFWSHAHHAFTIVSVFDAAKKIVFERNVPLYDYAGIDAGQLKRGDVFSKMLSVDIGRLPAGSYRVQTQALFRFATSDRRADLQGPPSEMVFALEQPLPKVGSGAQPTQPGGAPQPGATSKDHAMVGACQVSQPGDFLGTCIALWLCALALRAVRFAFTRHAPRD